MKPITPVEPPSGDRIVICAVDLGPLTARVLYHAAGFARALGARLKVVHVAETAKTLDGASALSHVYAHAIPYDAGDDEPDLAVRTGPVVERILEEVHRPGVVLLVVGTRALGAVAKFVLGSTSAGILDRARVPVLLVPLSDLDIVLLGSARGSMVCGSVLAPIDLAETNTPQLLTASAIAQLAGQPLIVLTVAPPDTDEHETAILLRHRVHGLPQAAVTSIVVRRGEVAKEIARCAQTEHAGLVVMGLRAAARGRPGANAVSVLRTSRAFVLAVPELSQPLSVQPHAEVTTVHS